MSGAARRSPLDRNGGPPPPLEPSSSTTPNGGEFLLQLLRRPPHSNPSPSYPLPIDAPHRHYEDPAVAMVGPSHSLSPPNFPDLSSSQMPPWLFPAVLPQPPRYAPPGFSPPGLSPPGSDYARARGPPGPPAPQFFRGEARQLRPGARNYDNMDWGRGRGSGNRQQQRDAFGSQRSRQASEDGRGFLKKEPSGNLGMLQFGSFDVERNRRENGGAVDVKRFPEPRSAGLSGYGSGLLERDRVQLVGRKSASVTREDRSGRSSVYLDKLSSSRDVVDLGKEKMDHHKEEENYRFASNYMRRGTAQRPLQVEAVVEQCDNLVESNLEVDVQEMAESLLSDNDEGILGGEEGERRIHLEAKSVIHGKTVREEDILVEQIAESLALKEKLDESNELKRIRGSRGKDYRLDTSRGHNVSSQRVRYRRAAIPCRRDINMLTPYFLSIYKSLIPAEEEKAKQKQLLLTLENLVNKEWPGARLHLYGSCANSFGVSNSDIDVCLAIDSEMSKSEILSKLADILQSDNLQNVQALIHARVPIVKLMDPISGISCDICINNLLAVVNTKLLKDYAQIDERLRQLAFIVKHWAKSRGVNETYQGTLSSYAYVLMCIHFLQLRRPAILPCLQEMGATYVVTVDDVECSFFDQVEKLRGFGSRNKESIAELLWAFFNYWAYCHDYANDVISIRTRGILSKLEKDWTRRIGNDRHLICIEDPFEISHDLGRVVDKFSIKILREEFERAANILQFDPNPSVTLFEPYVRESSSS